MRKQPNKGFTLVELLVVLAVVTIVSSISFGAFRSISDGNKRTSCQSNLSQIFKSVRLYSQDNDGRLPYLNENGDPNMATYATPNETPNGGIGLWSLYTFRKPGFQSPASLPAGNSTNCPLSTTDPVKAINVDLPAQFEDSSQVTQGFVGLSGYVRSAKVFHCPADNYAREIQYRDLSDSPDFPCKTVTENSPTLLIKDGIYNYLNPSYLSYQTTDDVSVSTTEQTPPTYSSFRRPEKNSSTQTVPYRQVTPYKLAGGPTSATRIIHRPIREMTVLTWCRFHRSLDNQGATQTGARLFDNVLFADGSVQSLPAEQEVQTAAGVKDTCKGWERVPREKAENMQSAGDCIPSP